MATKKKKNGSKTNGNSGQSFSFASVMRFIRDDRFLTILGVVILLFSLFLVLAFVSYLFTWSFDQSYLSMNWSDLVADATITVENWTGKTGAWLANLFVHRWFGLPSLGLVLVMVLVASRLMGFKWLPFGKTTLYILFLMVWSSITFGYLFATDAFYLGGAYGFFISRWLNSTFGKVGTLLILAATAFIFVVLVFRSVLPWLKSLLRKDEGSDTPLVVAPVEETVTESPLLSVDQDNFPTSIDDIPDPGVPHMEETELELELEPEPEPEPEPEIEPEVEPDEYPTKEQSGVEFVVEKTGDEEQTVEQTAVIADQPMGDYDPRLDLSKYRFPGFELLDDHPFSHREVDDQELQSNKNKIVETLKNYGISIDKIKATIGPSVTLYEIVPAPGVKVSKIKNLEDDIALSLAALGIRIIAPIPGKGTIGIEVPNLKPEMVPIRTVISSQKFVESKFDLPIVLGKTIQNEVYTFDLTKAPHLLVAGATGQGKSVGLNTIIMSLLYRKHPAEMKMVLVDPKKVELSLYKAIERHFLAKLPDEEEAIITETEKVVATLKSLCVEMDSRYDLLKNAGVRTIKEYNEKFTRRMLNPGKGHRYLPYIVVVIDEFADLIQKVGREAEDPITRLAQLARAIGIHLIIATQRPSTDVITGLIKANFPARIAFRVTAMVDSRTILDSPGANQLIGKGDMIISRDGDMTRVQCAFVDTHEVERVVEFIGKQQGPPMSYELPEIAEESNTIESIDYNKRDDLFEDAARLIVQAQQGSTSLIQRKFSIGYTRAGRIVDQLESAGIVGPPEGSKPRQVYYTDITSLEQYLQKLSTESTL